KLNFLRPIYKTSFVKMLSLSSIVALLSSASPVYSKTVSPKEAVLISAKSPSVAFPQSVISVVDDYNVDASDQENYVTARPAGSTLTASAVSDYVNFLINTLSKKSSDNAIVNVLAAYSGFTREAMQDTLKVGNVARLRTSKTFVKEDFSEEQKMSSNISPLRFILANEMQRNVRASLGVALGDGAAASDYSGVAIGRVDPECLNVDGTKGCAAASALAERAIAIGLSARVNGYQGIAIGAAAGVPGKHAIAIGAFAAAQAEDSIGIGRGVIVSADQSIGIGRMAHALGKSSIAIGSEYNADNPDDYTTAKSDYSTALGSGSKALEYGASVFGHRAYATGKEALSMGFYSKAEVEKSVAIGAESVANRAAGVFGYTSLAQGSATNTEAHWKSTRGAVSVGDHSKGITRQITGVAAGSEAADAVNVRQLRDLEDVVRKNGWKLSAGGANGTTVLMDGDVDFSAGSTNLQITKGDKDNKLKFDLAKDVALTSLKAGTNTFDATGLVITGGPKITTDGIGAGSKKITGVATGTDDTDAVNFAQLKEIKEQVASSSFVKQDAKTHLITIGKDADGNKIDIVNKKGENRVISGIANGAISDVSTEAMTGQQLHQFGTSIAGYLGGGASFSGGTWTPPSFKVKTVNANGKEDEQSYKTVAEAFAGVGNSFTNIKNEIKNEITNVVTKVEGDSLSWNDAADAFVARHEHKRSTEETGKAVRTQENSKIKFLANGDVSTGSTDAINGSQLYSLGDTFAAYLGGGAKYENGQWTAPTFKVKTVNGDGTEGKEKVYNDVATALADVGNSFTNIKNEITNVVTKVEGDSLSWSKKDGAFVAHHAEKGVEEESVESVNSKIKFLANGDVSTGSTDAINGSQLFDTNNKVAAYFGGGAKYEDGKWTPPSFKVKTVNGDGTEGEKTVYDVATALADVGNSFTNIKNEITNVVTKVEGDSLSWSKEYGAFVARHEHKQSTEEAGKAVRTQENSKITFLANGEVSSTSTDAVTGNQLYSLNNTFAKYLGGGAGYDKEGNWKAPSFKVKTVKADGTEGEETVYNDVATALAGVGNSFTNIKNEITNVVTKVEGDSLSWSKEDGAFVAHHAEKVAGEESVKPMNSKITFLANGEVSKVSTDAINGSQLFETNNKVASYFGGEAKYENGQWTAPSFKVKTVNGDGAEAKETVYHNVADAFAGVGNSITNVKNEITKQINNEISNVKGDSLVKKDANTNYITIGKEVEGSEINIANSKKELRTLSGVKAAEKENEAVNKGQLDTSIKKVEDQLTNVTEQVKGDALLWNKEAHAFVARHEQSTEEGGKSVRIQENSKITSLLNGEVSKTSTDAINGSQLFETNNKVAAYFGGDAKYDKGEWKAPSFKIKTVNSDGKEDEQSYKTVAEAFAGVGSSFTNIKNNISKEINNVKSDSLLWNDAADAFVARHEHKQSTEETGKAVRTQENSKITFLANGDVSPTSTDAVTGKQLYSLSDTFATYLGGGAKYENGQWTAPEFKVKTVKADGTEGEETVYKDVASALAGVGNSFTNIKNEITNVVTKVEGDSLSWSKEANAFVAHHAEKGAGEETVKPVNSKIKFLANGEVSSTSTDAVTGNQLYSMSSTLATYLGGGAGYDDKGEWKAPTFKIKTVKDDGSDVEDKEYKTVAEALAGVGTSITNVKKEINNEITNVKGDSLVKWDEATKLIKIGEEKEGSKINIKNKDGGARTISGVAAGSAETDAVNFSQLQKVEKDVKEQVAASSFVKQDLETKHLTIGKETDGDKIDIANNKNEKRTLTGIKGGALSADSNEAITGSQINKIGEDVAGFFGGGAAFSGGAFTKPSYEIHSIRKNGEVGASGSVHHDVGSALSALDYSLGNVNTRITNTINDFNQKITDSSQHIEKDALLWNEGAHAFVARHEKSTEEKGRSVRTQENSKITFLLDGNVSEGSTDAVTGNQLYSMGHALSTYLGGGASFNEGAFTQPTYKLSSVSNDGTVTENSFNDVGAAFTGLDANIKNVNARIKEVSQGVAQDSLSWSKEDDAFIAKHGAEKTASKIKFVAGGDLSKNSTDAVNGTQLFETNDKVVTYLGGDAKYENGQWTAPSFKVKTVKDDGSDVEDKEYKTVAEALAGVGTSITNVKKEITNVVSDSLVKQDAETKAINIGKEVEGSEINIANKTGADRTLSGVKAATQNNEAVNKGQLDKRLEELSKNIQSEDSAVVLYDKNKDENGTTNYKSVTLGKGENRAPVALHNVADGKIAENSHDAINGGQINKISQDIAKFLGGNAVFNNGAFTAPTYSLSKVDAAGQVEQTDFNDVGAAFTGLDSNIKNVNARIKEVSQGVAQDSLSWSKDYHAFVAKHGEGGQKANSKITFLQAGTVSESSTDAITGSQLYLLGDKVAKYLGGGAKYEDGKWTAPIFTVKAFNTDGTPVETRYNNVAEAFAGVGNSFMNIHKEITNVVSKVEGDSLSWGSDDHAFVAKHGKEGSNSKIKFLASGEISAASTEAVNGSQLYSLQDQFATYLGGGAGYDDKGEWKAPKFKLKTVKEDGSPEEIDYSNVAEAFAGVGSSITNVQNKVTNEITNQINHLQSDDSAVVHYDKNDDEKGTINYASVTFGKGQGSAAVGLHNVADGKIAQDSRDVVTGGQIHKIGEDVAKFLGGNTSFKDGSFTQPTYKLSKVEKNGVVTESSFQDVGGAFTGLDENIKNVNQRIKEVSEGVAQDSLLWSDDAHAFVARHEKKQEEKGRSVRTQENSKITFLLDGDVSKDSTDAVTGKQLYSLGDTFATYLGGGAKYEKGQWKAPKFKLKTVKEDGSGVGEESYDSVAEAFAGVGSSFTNIHKELKNEINKVVGDSLVKQNEDTHVISVGGEKSGSEV
ncbi:hypothetical protein, partial [Bartonella taylorii]|uniref:hypothetical protein n=1 Tax=Bartonella taylorii TaxID=33046 RepID=UPI001ABA30E3